jgi:hypothetical protein
MIIQLVFFFYFNKLFYIYKLTAQIALFVISICSFGNLKLQAEVKLRLFSLISFITYAAVMSFRFFTEDGLGGVYNKDGSEAMDWDEEGDNPYRTETLTSLEQWRARQSIFEPTIDDLEKVDVVMAELEHNIASIKKDLQHL